MQQPQPARWPKVLLWVSAGFFLLSMPCLFLGVLGLFGIVADVGPQENRDIGFGFLRVALVPLGIATLLLVVALTARRSKRA